MDPAITDQADDTTLLTGTRTHGTGPRTIYSVQALDRGDYVREPDEDEESASDTDDLPSLLSRTGGEHASSSSSEDDEFSNPWDGNILDITNDFDGTTGELDAEYLDMFFSMHPDISTNDQARTRVGYGRYYSPITGRWRLPALGPIFEEWKLRKQSSRMVGNATFHYPGGMPYRADIREYYDDVALADDLHTWEPWASDDESATSSTSEGSDSHEPDFR